MRPKLLIIKYLVYSVIFNLHYLPFKQAIKLPILFLTKPYFVKLKGQIIIHGKIEKGMILFGVPGNNIFSPNEPFMWDNRGGLCVFMGKMGINPNSGIRIYYGAKLKFGENVSLGQQTRIICKDEIIIGNNVLISWELTLMDTDLHPFYNIVKDELSKESSPIFIGNNVFVGSRCTIQKGSIIQDNCVVASNTTINKKFDNKYTLIAGNPGMEKIYGYTRIVCENRISQEMSEIKEEHSKTLFL